MGLISFNNRLCVYSFLFLLWLCAPAAHGHYKKHDSETILNTQTPYSAFSGISYNTLYTSSLWQLGYGYNKNQHDDFKTWVLSNPYYQNTFTYYHQYLNYNYYHYYNKKSLALYLSKLYLYYVYIKPKDEPTPIIITLPDNESIPTSVNTPAYLGFSLFFLMALGRYPLWFKRLSFIFKRPQKTPL